MSSLPDSCFYAFLLAVCAVFVKGQPAGFLSDLSQDDPTVEANKRTWSMLRLGRGLQMLRLGKRDGLDSVLSSSSDGSVPWDRLSADQLNNLLNAIKEVRDRGRRQPPLPRYGRQISSTARDLLDVLTGDSAGDSDFFRQPSKGGRRYKRSVGSSPDVFSPFDSSYLWTSGPKAYRAVSLPRYGRYMGALPRLQTKAVPRPRIGRDNAAKLTNEKTALQTDSDGTSS